MLNNTNISPDTPKINYININTGEVDLLAFVVSCNQK